MAKAIKVGGKARYNKKWLQSTCSYLDSDGTNGWAEVVSLDRFYGDVKVALLRWPNGIERKVITPNLEGK
tara:strand:+ start:157 stop:366 length:210 start_codon:yes stop_codon:yes gene_type:complete